MAARSLRFTASARWPIAAAAVSPDGYTTLLGRRSDLIISGGFNIYPREIEELLLEQPADGGAVQLVGLVLEVVDLDAVLVDLLQVPHVGQQLVQFGVLKIDAVIAAGPGLARFALSRTNSSQPPSDVRPP